MIHKGLHQKLKIEPQELSLETRVKSDATATRTLTRNASQVRCYGRVSSSCSTSGTRCVRLHTPCWRQTKKRNKVTNWIVSHYSVNCGPAVNSFCPDLLSTLGQCVFVCSYTKSPPSRPSSLVIVCNVLYPINS